MASSFGPVPVGVAVGDRATFDAECPDRCDPRLRDELNGEPLDRGLLHAFLDLVAAVPAVGARFLVARHPRVPGLDLSPRMMAIAREHAPQLPFTVGSMLALPGADAGWGGVLSLYSIIYLDDAERAHACREFARALRPGGWLLLAFDIGGLDAGPGSASGPARQVTTWFGEPVGLDPHALDPNDIVADLEAHGFRITADIRREPTPDAEFPGRRCYLLAQRR